MAGPEPKLREFFSEAVQFQTAQEQAAYLEQACQGDAELRAQLEGLLQAHREAGSFLQEPPTARAGTVDAPPVLEQPGAVIGPYKLLQKIGEGGMGTVYMAEQSHPVRRKVALKVIKAGMDSGQVIARFEAERQALALMDHPNIAKVLDAGTTAAGRPYFVMELVKGVPITMYCDENHLPPKARLDLFIQVCQAVQHAHHKGVIHRDLKPTNVLVTLYDEKPVPKVIDFGVAKATGGRLTERTMFTGFGQIVGTLEYMSPEQARLNALDVDTRGDIYSLGVLLYELLTGTTPFDKKRLREAAFDEMLRMIREEEPPKPSTRLSTAEARTSIAVNRGMEANKLSGLLRGELDWIVMKALEKDRNRRYETAKDFATDVERYLADEPVLACPASIGYRLRKFVRRNKGPVLAVALVALALVGGLIATTWGMIQAEQASRNALAAQLAEAERAGGERRAKEEAQKRLAQIEMGTEILASVFRDLDPQAAEREGVTFRVLLGRRLIEATRQLEGEAVGDPLVVARLQHVLGVSLFELGHVKQAEEVLVKAGQTRQRLLGADHLDTAATKHHLAVLYRGQGEYALAETLLKEVLAVRTVRLGADHYDTLTSQHYLALLYDSQGKRPLAETLLKEVLAIRVAKLGADHLDTLTSQHRLAALYKSQGKYALAETLNKEVLAVRTAKLGADHLDTVATKSNLAALYLSQEKYAPAKTLYKEVLAVRTAKLGNDHPDTLSSQHRLALVYQAQGNYALAEALYKEVLAIRTARLGADHFDTLTSQHELANLYHSQRKYALAETLYKDVLVIRTAKLGNDHPDTLHSQYWLAMLYWSMRKLDRSIPLFEEMLKLKKAKLGSDHPETLGTQVDLGANYFEAGRFAEAIPLLEEVHQKRLKAPELAWVGGALLRAYVQVGKTTEATALVAEQVRAARNQFPADSSPLTDALANAGQMLLDAKAYADAEPLLREVLSFREKTAGTFWATHHTQSLFGAVLLGQQRYAAAEPLLLQGYAGLKEREATIPGEVKGYPTQALERLVQLYDAWGKPDEAAKWRRELEARRSRAEKSASP